MSSERLKKEAFTGSLTWAGQKLPLAPNSAVKPCSNTCTRKKSGQISSVCESTAMYCMTVFLVVVSLTTILSIKSMLNSKGKSHSYYQNTKQDVNSTGLSIGFVQHINTVVLYPG